jgi:hypothetical protein
MDNSDTLLTVSEYEAPVLLFDSLYIDGENPFESSQFDSRVHRFISYMKYLSKASMK